MAKGAEQNGQPGESHVTGNATSQRQSNFSLRFARHTTAMDTPAPSYPECQDLAIAERPNPFAQQEILAPLELTKGELIYVAPKDCRWCRTRSARRFKKGTHIRPQSVNSLGGDHTAGTQRVDLLDRVREKTRNEKPPDRVGLFQPEGGKATPLLLARMRSPLIPR
jgi:hypothetical protein